MLAVPWPGLGKSNDPREYYGGILVDSLNATHLADGADKANRPYALPSKGLSDSRESDGRYLKHSTQQASDSDSSIYVPFTNALLTHITTLYALLLQATAHKPTDRRHKPQAQVNASLGSRRSGRRGPGRRKSGCIVAFHHHRRAS